MGQISQISAVLAVLTDGANFKKWGQILKMGANLADFCGFRHAFADSVPPWGGLVFCQVLAAAVMG